MEDVSDPPFRALCKENGADLMYTEFISSEGLIRDAAKSRAKLDIFEYERPIGIQIFGSELESMIEAAEICAEANPNLIDINYGCPVKKVVCKGAGASMLQDIPKMVRLTKAIVDAVDKPVTVKTRLGWDDSTKNVVEVAERLQDIGWTMTDASLCGLGQTAAGAVLSALKQFPDLFVEGQKSKVA